jgi:hypothetical protein
MKFSNFFKRRKQEIKNESFIIEEEPKQINLSEKVDTSIHISGLYFMHTMSIIDGRAIYAVKIGQSSDIGRRMYTYRTHTPFCMLGGVCEVRSALVDEYENICHIKLHNYALPNIICSGEWEIVSEENYKMLCERCISNDGFRQLINEWVAC